MGECTGRCMCKLGLADECLCDSRFTSVKSSTEVEEETSRSLDVESANPMRMMKGV